MSLFEKRLKESKDIKSKYPNKCPIKVENNASDITLEKSKFLVPNDITIAEFMHYIRKYIKNIKKDQAIFCFIKNEIPVMSSLISSPHYVDKDGFVYINIRTESVFG